MTSHVVFGAGLIGCYLGGVMQLKGLKVQLVCRPAVQAKLMAGLTLSDYQDHRAQLAAPAFIDPRTLAAHGPGQLACDYVWLTVKCTGVEQAMPDIQPLIAPHTVILCCQNGLGSQQIVQQAYPQNRVLRVMVPFNVVELAPGQLHRGSQGELCIESAPEKGGTDTLVNGLKSDLLPVSQTQDMPSLLWAKLQLNLGNSINALANIPVKAMLGQRDYRRVIAALMDELLAVTDKQSIILPKVTSLKAHLVPVVLRLPNFLFKLVANRMLAIDPQVRTSMWWDVSQGKPTEIAYLNGAVVNYAERLGIPCPANKRIVSLIEGLPGHQQENYSGAQLLALITRSD
ncbi:MAG: 2-dehydropantoate 2-reductase [Paraglaciecola sp.]|jgi:2-dehydropantoate 2-reductase